MFWFTCQVLGHYTRRIGLSKSERHNTYNRTTHQQEFTLKQLFRYWYTTRHCKYQSDLISAYLKTKKIMFSNFLRIILSTRFNICLAVGQLIINYIVSMFLHEIPIKTLFQFQ